MAKEKKEMTKARRAVNITILVLQIIIIIACIVFSVIMVVSSKGNQEGKLRNGTNLMPVMSNSMDGNQKDSFTINDLVFIKKFKDTDNKAEMIKEGDIVSFKQFLPDAKAIVYVTHRVIHVVTPSEREAYAQEHEGAVLGYDVVTQGDLAKEIDSNAKEYKNFSEIEGYYTGQIKGLGGVITFLKKPEAFFPLIVVPLVLLLLYNAYIIVKAALDAKFAKLNQEKDEQTKLAIQTALEAVGYKGELPKTEEKAEDAPIYVELGDSKIELPTKEEKVAPTNELDVEEIKKKAIEDYIRQQAVEEYKAQMEKEAPKEENKEDKSESDK